MAVEHNSPLTDFCLITLQQTMTSKLSHCMVVCMVVCSLVSGQDVSRLTHTDSAYATILVLLMAIIGRVVIAAAICRRDVRLRIRNNVPTQLTFGVEAGHKSA